MRTLLACALVLSFLTPATGQQRQPSLPAPSPTPAPATAPQEPRVPADDDDEVVRITTNLVQIDAVVVDKNGRQVTDLIADDFEIFEDGKPQQITNFSYVSNEAKAPEEAARPSAAPADKNALPVPPARLRPEQVRRTMALVVDDLGLSFESAYFTRNALKRFVDEQMQPNDLVAIIRTGAGIGALQQFTSDKRMLYAAIERVKFNLNGRGGVGMFAPLAGNSQLAGGQAGEEGRGNNRGETDEDRDIAAELDQFREEIFSVGTLGAVNYVVRGMRELPGRKSVVLFSDGFVLFSRNDGRVDNTRVRQALRNLTDLANRASVVIYSLDPRGLVYTGLTAADDTSGFTPEQLSRRISERSDRLFETQSGLRYLAEETGGFAVVNSNDLNRGVRRVLEDQKGYYLIGYRPAGETFDRRYHKFGVKVKRPGLKVRTRTGFYGITDENARPVRRTRDEQLLAAITSPFSAGSIPVRLTSLFASDAKSGTYMRSLMHVDASNLKFTEEADGWHKTTLEVLGIAFGDNGKIVEQNGVTHTLKFRGKTHDDVRRNGLVFNFNIPIKKGGAYQLRVAVRDAASEQVGSASQFIEAPDLKKDRLALSGLIVNGFDPRAATQPDAKAAAPSPPHSDSDTPPAPNSTRATAEDEPPSEQLAGPAVRRLRRFMHLDFAYLIYNAKLDKATRLPQLTAQTRLFRDGQIVFNGNVNPIDIQQQPDLKRIGVTSRLQLGSNLLPGEYVLQVIVIDQLREGKRRTMTQWIDFEIVK